MKPTTEEVLPPNAPEDRPDHNTKHDGSDVTSQDRIDEAMAESFPASDPPSWNAGVKHKEDDLTKDSSKE